MRQSSELTYTPAWWVPGAHTQTLWGKFTRNSLVVPTRAEQWEMPDGDFVELRRLDATNLASDVPRLLVLHGLEGTINSHYLRGMLDQARQRGWPADVMLFRGCNGEANRARRIYHSGETSDLAHVLHRLVAQEPHQAIVLAGFSLGGNVLLKWLGETGRALPHQVRAAVAVSVPFDLEAGCRHIERGVSRIYNRHFLRTLKQKALAKLEQYPKLFDRMALLAAKTLYDFDDVVTAPVHGFADAHDYYSRCSSIRFLETVAVPTLLLSAVDDPFLPPQILDNVAVVARNNRLLTLEVHKVGGHVGFVSGRNPFDQHFYAEERAIAFLSTHASASPAHDRLVNAPA